MQNLLWKDAFIQIEKDHPGVLLNLFLFIKSNITEV